MFTPNRKSDCNLNEHLTDVHLHKRRRRWWCFLWCCFIGSSVMSFLASREYLPDNVRLVLAIIGLPLWCISAFMISMTKFGQRPTSFGFWWMR